MVDRTVVGSCGARLPVLVTAAERDMLSRAADDVRTLVAAPAAFLNGLAAPGEANAWHCRGCSLPPCPRMKADSS